MSRPTEVTPARKGDAWQTLGRVCQACAGEAAFVVSVPVGAKTNNTSAFALCGPCLAAHASACGEVSEPSVPVEAIRQKVCAVAGRLDLTLNALTDPTYCDPDHLEALEALLATDLRAAREAACQLEALCRGAVEAAKGEQP